MDPSPLKRGGADVENKSHEGREGSVGVFVGGYGMDSDDSLRLSAVHVLWNSTQLKRQLMSVVNLCLILCDPTDCSMPHSPALHCVLEIAQVHVHWATDAV